MGTEIILKIAMFIYRIIFLLALFFSIKKCFLKEGRSKVALFFWVFFTNPYLIFYLSVVFAMIITAFTFIILGYDNNAIINGIGTISNMSLMLEILGSIFFVIAIILVSFIVGKWLKAPNVSLVTFVYMIFSVISALASINPGNDVLSVSVASGFNIIAFLILIGLFYIFVIRELAKLTDKKREISWKLFLVPPTLFLFVYYIFDFAAQLKGDSFANLVVQFYSLLILMMFFWTFYIVIKNINATNAAIEAKYESEHDKLTGLYNKGKYINMKEANFDNPSSIAIYNFDVNNLKYINDNFGHELGDELIIKAANSIHAVTSDKVYGFRMGGDEYVMIGMNITEEEAKDVYTKWEQALEKLNQEGQMYCVMACGLQYASGDFNYDELYHQADEEMYVNKKAKKEKGETSHIKSQPSA